MKLYIHKDSKDLSVTTITRLADKSKVTLTGDIQFGFMREMAYAAGDKNLSDDAYVDKADEISAKYFALGE